jgi:transcriptional regulator with XRE-family HTH domain
MRFHARLQSMLLQRRRVNPNYSLRSLARGLAADHATLSQILRGERRVTAKTIRRLGPRLGLHPGEIDACCSLEHEAAILGVISHPRFRADSRWLAITLNIPVDDVNLALQSLLRKRLLAMTSAGRWQTSPEA